MDLTDPAVDSEIVCTGASMELCGKEGGYKNIRKVKIEKRWLGPRGGARGSLILKDERSKRAQGESMNFQKLPIFPLCEKLKPLPSVSLQEELVLLGVCPWSLFSLVCTSPFPVLRPGVHFLNSLNASPDSFYKGMCSLTMI